MWEYSEEFINILNKWDKKGARWRQARSFSLFSSEFFPSFLTWSTKHVMNLRKTLKKGGAISLNSTLSGKPHGEYIPLTRTPASQRIRRDDRPRPLNLNGSEQPVNQGTVLPIICLKSGCLSVIRTSHTLYKTYTEYILVSLTLIDARSRKEYIFKALFATGYDYQNV